MASTGKVVQVIGSTFDAQFPEDGLPEIYNAVTCEVTVHGSTLTLFGEVAKHLGTCHISEAGRLSVANGLSEVFGVEVDDNVGTAILRE